MAKSASKIRRGKAVLLSSGILFGGLFLLSSPVLAAGLPGVTATPTAGGAQVAFTLNRDASVTVEILNVAGRAIRTLTAGSPVAAAAVTTLVWDGSSTLGTRAPNGRYLVRITAQTEDGEQASGMAAVSLRR